MLPTFYLGAILLAVAPYAYGVVTGAYLVPGVIAQSLLRRPGIALVTATLCGIATAPFIPNGFSYIGAFALIGALQEVPFLIARYRRWDAWIHLVTAAAAGIATGVVVFVLLGTERAQPVVQIVEPLSFLLGFLVFTALGLAVARGVERTGVTRGLRR